MTAQILTSQLLRDTTRSLDGQRVSVQGLLVVEGDLAYVEIPNSRDEALRERVGISDSSLLNRLLDVVPCHLGGAYLYRDSVRLVGVLEVSDHKVAMLKVESGVVSRDGEELTF